MKSVCTSASTNTTKREREVLLLLSEGYTAKEIAALLYISTHTVRTHRKHLIRKLNAKNSIHMVAIAVRKGMV